MTYLIKQFFYIVLTNVSSVENFQIERSNGGRLCSPLLLIIMGCVCLSACSSRSTPAPVSSLYSSSSVLERNKTTITSSYYIVTAGDTLFSIAWRANSDVRRIAKLNNLKSPYNIYPKQKLFLTEYKKKKATKASKNKGQQKKSNKNTNSVTKNTSKIPLASSKKQAYGENVTKNETIQKTLPKSVFSKKIKQWRWPVKGEVLETFSNRAQGNKGIDIAGRRGTKISAAAKGKVVYAGNALRGYGKLIIIKHNDDYLSAYAHNDKILVKEQQLINIGDVIATMGDSDANKVMLHFEIRYQGKSVDPEKYLP